MFRWHQLLLDNGLLISIPQVGCKMWGWFWPDSGIRIHRIQYSSRSRKISFESWTFLPFWVLRFFVLRELWTICETVRLWDLFISPFPPRRLRLLINGTNECMSVIVEFTAKEKRFLRVNYHSFNWQKKGVKAVELIIWLRHICPMSFNEHFLEL